MCNFRGGTRHFCYNFLKMAKKLTEQEQQIAKALEEQARQREKYLPCYKLLRKKGLKFKHARVGDMPVEYCRVDELEKTVNDNHEQLKELLQVELPLEQLKKNMVYFARPQNSPALRYPPILEFSQKPTQFISFPFNTEESRKGLMMGIIFAILCLVLFPVWPFELKYAVWLVSLYLLVFLVGLLVLRLALYSVASLFGVSFWLFPNLLSDTSILASFKPVISFEKWESSKLNMVLRLAILGTFIYYSYVIYKDPTIIHGTTTINSETLANTQEAVKDVHDWGVSKIKRETNFSQRAIASVEDILNKTADNTTETDAL